MWKNLEIFNIRFGEVDDIRFRFKDAAGLGGTKAKMFRCWLNAQFITDFDGDDSMKEITLTKNEIDEAIKDKKYTSFYFLGKITGSVRSVCSGTV